MRYAWVILGLLAGCATTGEVKYDLQGRLYPEQCRGDLSWVEARVEYRPTAEIPRVRNVPGEYPIGYVDSRQSPPLIVVANDIDPDEMKDVIRHERCHVIAGAWHSYPDASRR